MENTLQGRYLLDTNILVYSLDKDSPFYQTSKEVLNQCFKGEIEGVVAHQNLVELVNILTGFYQIPKTQALKDAKNFANSFNLALVFPLATTFSTFTKFLQKTKRIRGDIFDVYLAATMWDNKVEQIITANEADFTDIPKIKVLNPFFSSSQ